MNEPNSHRQNLRSSAINGGASVLNIVIGLLRMKVVAVLIGPAAVGMIGILQNIMATASTVSALGFGNVGTRQIAEAHGRGEQADVDAARRALFWGTLILAALGGLVFWALRDALANRVLDDVSLAPTVGWLAVGVALTVAAGSQRALLTGMRRIGDIARVTVLSSLASTMLGIPLLIWLGRDGVLWFILLTPLASFVISHGFVARLPGVKSPPTPLRVLADQWRTLARLGAAFMVAGLAGTVGQLVVRTLVQNDLGAESLGYFQAAWVISMTYIGFVLNAMGTDYYPRLTAAIHDHAQANRLVNEQTEVAILLAGPVVLGMLALVPWVIQLLYSVEFSPAVAILRWQILGDALKIISWPMGFVLLASGKGKTFMLKESLVMGVFVVMVWLLLPYFRLESTGIAFFAMYLVNVPILLVLARSLTGFRWSRTVTRDLLIFITTSVIVSLAGTWNDYLGAAIGLLAATTFGVMALVRLATMAELGGTLGKVAATARRLLIKIGVIHD
jgi:O-antigen/teichoic acid export membrane protein